MAKNGNQGKGGGPKTKEGKERSSLNALKHGFEAQSRHALRFMAQYIGMDLEEVLSQMRAFFLPEDVLEEHLVYRIAHCSWRLAVARRMETRILENHPELYKPGPAYEKVMHYERLVDIHLHRAIDALYQKRAAEKK